MADARVVGVGAVGPGALRAEQVGQGDAVASAPAGIGLEAKTVGGGGGVVAAAQNTADVVQVAAGGAEGAVEAARGREQVVVAVRRSIGVFVHVKAPSAGPVGSIGPRAAGKVRRARADGDVGLNLFAGSLHVLREAGHLKNGLLVS